MLFAPQPSWSVRIRRLGAFLSLLVATAAVPMASAALRTVQPDGLGEFPTIQSALDASAEGDSVALESGVYVGAGNRELDFAGKGILLFSTAGDPEACVLDCERSGRGLHFRGGEDSLAVVLALTIRNGLDPDSLGGGAVRCSTATPRFERCVFAGNESAAGGGALACFASSPSFSECRFTGNLARQGGAAYLDSSSAPAFTRCTLAANSAEEFGGGIFSASETPLTLSRTILFANCASLGGDEAFLSDGELQFTCSAVDSSGVDGEGIASYAPDVVFGDPEFCAPILCAAAPAASGLFTVGLDSDCASANSPCGLTIGSEAEGCPPPPDPTGACCRIGGWCLIVSESACVDSLGRYLGDDTSCAPNPCPTYHLEPDGSGDLPTIQAAINIAPEGAIIELADGSYTGAGNRDVEFLGKALTLRSESGDPSACYLDCAGGGRGLYFKAGEDSSTIVMGLGIRNGSVSTSQRGGGIAIVGASPRLLDCRIEGNASGWQGGGVYCENGTPSFTRCVITGNRAQDGGGIYVRPSTEPRFEQCTIASNLATGSGGGMLVASAELVMLARSILFGNCAQQSGDEAYLFFANSRLAFTCCLLEPDGIEGPGSTETDGGCQFTNPRFCSALSCNAAPALGGDYRLHANSAALPANNTCGQQIGPLGEGCVALPVGACCLTTGGCVAIDAIGCAELNGSYAGDGSLCASANCAPGGSCCFTDGQCEVRTQPLCSSGGGTYGGNGTSCNPYPCPTFVVRANGTGAFATIQDALDTLGNGAVIDLASGTYTGVKNRNLNFHGKSITLRREPNSVSMPILDCQGLGRGIYFNGGEGPACRVEKIAIVRGVVSGTARGAAVACVSSSPTLDGVVLSGNRAIGDGGAVYCFDASPTILNSTLARNRAGRGAGIFADGASNVQIQRSIVWGNCADTAGGELFLASASSSASFSCSDLDSSDTGGSGQKHYGASMLFNPPLLCSPALCSAAPTASGDYRVSSFSNCLAGASPCGQQIGALGQGCTTPPGACCFGSTCQPLLAATCAAEGGEFRGVGVPCSPSPCASDGACCLPSGSCQSVTEAECAAAGGRFLGTGISCASGGCGSNAGGALLVHATPGLSYSPTAEYCGTSVLSQCGSGRYSVTGGDTYVFHVIAARPSNAVPKISGVTFGIAYDSTSFELVDRGVCADFELAEPNWPAPGSGTAVSWTQPRSGQFTEVYWFAGFNRHPGTPTEFAIVPHPTEGAFFADEHVPARLDPVQCLGSLGFDMPGDWCCVTVAVDDEAPLPREVRLLPVQPNPSDGPVEISYELPSDRHVDLAVYGPDGRRLRTLERGDRPAGRHVITWSRALDPGEPLPQGVYFLRLSAGSEGRVQKLLVLR